MCFGGSPSSSPLPAPAPQQAQGNVTQAADAERQRRRAAVSNTMLTGAQGAGGPQLSKGKSLLGS